MILPKLEKSKSGNTGLRLISYSFGYESKICHLFFVLVLNSLFVIELRKIDWRKCLKISIKTPVVGLAKDNPCQFDLRVLSTRNIFSLFKLSWLTLRYWGLFIASLFSVTYLFFTQLGKIGRHGSKILQFNSRSFSLEQKCSTYLNVFCFLQIGNKRR